MKKLPLMILLLFAVSSLASAETMYSVGISPNYADLGEIDKGSSHSVTFRVFSRSTEPLLIFMEDYNAGMETMKSKQPGMMANFSEEDAVNWVTFLKNPLEMDSASGEDRSWKDFSFFINIPQNAEPGYHALMLRPSIYVPEQNLGRVGSRVVGVTSFLVIFKVSGKAERSGIILDAVRSSQGSSQIEIDTYFQNTGTVTMHAKAFNAIEGVKAESSLEKLAPQEIKVMKSYLPLTGLVCRENCEMSTEVDYFTGKAESSSPISIIGPLLPVNLPQMSKGIDLTLILIVVGLLLIAIVLAKRFFYEG